MPHWALPIKVNGALCSFVSSFTTAFNPQIVKLTAEREQENLHLLINRDSKFSFALAYVMAMPMIFKYGLFAKLMACRCASSIC